MQCARASVLLVVLVLWNPSAWAQNSAPTVAVTPFLLPASDKDTGFSKSLQDELTGILRQGGFVVVSADSSPRFEARGLLVRENSRLILHVALADTAYRSLVASEIIAVEDGLTALEPIRTAFASVVQKGKAYWEEVRDSPPPVPAVQDSLVFLSADEGAEVFWRGHESIGKIAGGRVTAPYYPFPSNAALTVSLEKPGYRVQTVRILLSPDKTEYSLPKLVKLRTDELHPFISTGRLLGLGVEYRKYFLPDWAFFGAEAYPFVQYRPDVKRSQTVTHLDLAASVGTWLLYPADSWFRVGVEASAMLNQTYTNSASPPQWYLDAMVVPFGVLVEWNFWGLTLENRVQVPYSLGLPSGLLGSRWVLIDGSVPLISFGTVIRW